MKDWRKSLSRRMSKKHGVYFSKKAAEEMGVSAIAVYQWVTGRRTPSSTNAKLIEKFYGIKKEHIKPGFFAEYE